MTTPDYPDFIGFKDANSFDQALGRIGRALVERKAQFLFGAGMSRDSKLPLAHGLAVTFLRAYFTSDEGGTKLVPEERLAALTAEFPFEAIAYAVENMPGLKRDDLTKALREVLIVPQPEPNEAHRDFLSLLGVPPRIRTVFTTNYDNLFEQALGTDFAVPITEENAKDLDNVREEKKDTHRSSSGQSRWTISDYRTGYRHERVSVVDGRLQDGAPFF